jgi:hypothetical protein
MSTINNILQVMFPQDVVITSEMLQTAAETGVQQAYRLCGSTGMFYKPGVLASSLIEDRLLPTISTPSGGAVAVSISPGKAVTELGYIIEITDAVIQTYSTAEAVVIASTTPFLFAKYAVETTDTVQSISVLSGTTVDVSVENAQDDFADLFYWSASSTLPVAGDAILIGKLDSGIVFLADYPNRNIALLNVLFTDEQTNPSGAIGCSVNEMHSVYEFLACRGRSSRTTENPFGMTDVDISDLGNLISSLVETPGIPANSFTATNGDFLKPTQNVVSGNYVDVAAGTYVDANGRFVDVDAITAIAVPSTDTWYYIYAQYVDLISGSSDHLLKSYEVTTSLASLGLPVAPKYIIGMVKCHLSGPTYVMDISDQRALLSCRSVAGEAPDAPYSLALTTGSTWDKTNTWGYSPDDDFVHESFVDTFITATWYHSATGEVSYFGVKAIPMTNLGVEIPGEAVDGIAQPTPPPTGSQDWTPRLIYTFHRMIPGIRYNVYLWAVGHAPGYPKSVTIDDDIVAGQGDKLEPPSNFTLTEVDNENSLNGLDITWGNPSGVAASLVLNYELYAEKNGTYSDSLTNSSHRKYSGTGHSYFMRPANGDTIDCALCAVDNAGYRGEFVTGSITLGDVTAPTWVTGDGLSLTTGLEYGYSAKDRGSIHTTWVRATWNIASDNKVGVGYYDVQFSPIELMAPYPDPEDISWHTVIQDGSQTPYIRFTGLQPGVTYGVRVRPVDNFGNAGTWTSWSTQIAGGNNAESLSIGTFSAQGINGGNLLSWTPNLPDVSQFEIYAKLSSPPSVPDDLIAVVDGVKREFYHAAPSIITTVNPDGSLITATTSGATWYYIVRPIGDETFQAGTESSVATANPIILDAATATTMIAEVVAARGDYATLDDRLAAPTAMSSQETIDARSGYSSLADRINSMASAAVDWGYTAIVAKSNGNYASIQAAISAAILVGGHWTILVAPGKYTENLTLSTPASVSIIGLGKVILDGTITSDGVGLRKLEGLVLYPSVTTANIVTVTQSISPPVDRHLKVSNVNVFGWNVTGSCFSLNGVSGIFVNTAIWNGAKGITFVTGTYSGEYLLVQGCRMDTTSYCVECTAANSLATITGNIFKSGGACMTIAASSTARIYNNVWKTAPTGAGTLDYAAIDGATVSNCVNANIEVFLDDDQYSNV